MEMQLLCRVALKVLPCSGRSGVVFLELTGQRRASRGVGGWVSRLLSRSSLVTVVDCWVASSVVAINGKWCGCKTVVF